jgi:DNA mismatch repair protein MutS
MKEIQNLKDELRICHLSLRYDMKENVLIYDRKLKDGPGDSVYGLEVARSLNLDDEFIRTAYEIRSQITHDLFNWKKSKYNSKVILDSCSICGEKDVTKLVTHHILEQEKADKNGFIGHIHKNIPGNLMCICDSCHKNLHQNGLEVSSLPTSKGLNLSIAN